MSPTLQGLNQSLCRCGMGGAEGTHLPENDGRVAHLLPEAARVGGCDQPWICGDLFREWPLACSGHSSGFGFPEHVSDESVVKNPYTFRTNNFPGNCLTRRFISRLRRATETVELGRPLRRMTSSIRSEEHTPEPQSRFGTSQAVFCLA